MAESCINGVLGAISGICKESNEYEYDWPNAGDMPPSEG